jgi:hypothetical protein
LLFPFQVFREEERHTEHLEPVLIAEELADEVLVFLDQLWRCVDVAGSDAILYLAQQRVLVVIDHQSDAHARDGDLLCLVGVKRHQVEFLAISEVFPE